MRRYTHEVEGKGGVPMPEFFFGTVPGGVLGFCVAGGVSPAVVPKNEKFSKPAVTF